jgi:hypothetical protein
MEVLPIGRHAVGHRSLHVVPDQFIRVKLWGIGRQRMCVKPRVTPKEVGDDPGSVRLSTIPDQEDRSANVPQKMPEKLNDLWGTNVLVWMKLTIQSKPSVSRGDCQG